MKSANKNLVAIIMEFVLYYFLFNTKYLILLPPPSISYNFFIKIIAKISPINNSL